MRIAKLFVPLALLSIAGCGGGIGPLNLGSLGSDFGGGGAGGASHDTSALQGTWAVRSIAAWRQDDPAGPQLQGCPATVTAVGDTFTCAAGETIVFRADGTVTDTAAGLNGTYTVSGAFLDVTGGPVVNGSRVLRSMISLNGTTLTMTTEYPAGIPPAPGTLGHPVVLTRILVKQ